MLVTGQWSVYCSGHLYVYCVLQLTFISIVLCRSSGHFISFHILFSSSVCFPSILSDTAFISMG